MTAQDVEHVQPHLTGLRKVVVNLGRRIERIRIVLTKHVFGRNLLGIGLADPSDVYDHRLIRCADHAVRDVWIVPTLS